MPAKRQPPAPEYKRSTGGPRAIGEISTRLTRQPLGKRGFASATLVAEWPRIVGTLLGAGSIPLKIAFPHGERAGGTLSIRVASGALATQLQHEEPQVIERINRYFGYAAVTRLVLSQGPLPARAPRRQGNPAESLADTPLPACLDNVEDPELKAVLTALGHRLPA